MHIAVIFYMDTVENSFGKPESMWGRVVANHSFVLTLAESKAWQQLTFFVPEKKDVETLFSTLLSDYRGKVNVIDAKILALLNERAKCSQTIGRYKRDRNELVYAPDREAEVLSRLIHANRGPIKPHDLLSIYREIMSNSANAA